MSRSAVDLLCSLSRVSEKDEWVAGCRLEDNICLNILQRAIGENHLTISDPREQPAHWNQGCARARNEKKHIVSSAKGLQLK